MDQAKECTDHCQPTPPVIALISLLLNIFLSGWGTILNGLMGPAIDTTQILFGVIQLVTTVCVVGWIWSIVWGIITVDKILFNLSVNQIFLLYYI